MTPPIVQDEDIVKIRRDKFFWAHIPVPQNMPRAGNGAGTTDETNMAEKCLIDAMDMLRRKANSYRSAAEAYKLAYGTMVEAYGWHITRKMA